MILPKNVWRWAFYDFANSSYVLIYQAFLLPVFFSTILLARGYSLSSWGIANGISTVFGVVLAILIGRYSDKHNRLVVFRWVIMASFLGMVAVSLAVGIWDRWVFYLYIITNSVFITSLSLSDSILPHVAEKASSHEYSGFAWGFGYLGGIMSMVVVVILQRLFSQYSPWVFLSVALFYLVFSVYALKGLKTVALNAEPLAEKSQSLSRSRKLVLLIGYWLISECITVIILFFSIFASKELGYSSQKIGVALLLVQLIGFPATWYGGRLVKRMGDIRLLGLSILIWGLVIMLMIIRPSAATFYCMALLTGLTIGNSQSLIRAQYANVIEKSESGLQFGIYSFISQAAVSIGPIVYGLASDSLHSQKIPLVILFTLMVIGYFIVRWVMLDLKKNLAAKPS